MVFIRRTIDEDMDSDIVDAKITTLSFKDETGSWSISFFLNTSIDAEPEKLIITYDLRRSLPEDSPNWIELGRVVTSCPHKKPEKGDLLKEICHRSADCCHHSGNDFDPETKVIQLPTPTKSSGEGLTVVYCTSFVPYSNAMSCPHCLDDGPKIHFGQFQRGLTFGHSNGTEPF